MKPTDPTTFGKSPAATLLARLLDSLADQKLSRRIATSLCKWQQFLGDAAACPRRARQLLILVKKAMVSAFEKDITAPEMVLRFCRSILIGKFRTLLANLP